MGIQFSNRNGALRERRWATGCLVGYAFELPGGQSGAARVYAIEEEGLETVLVAELVCATTIEQEEEEEEEEGKEDDDDEEEEEENEKEEGPVGGSCTPSLKLQPSRQN